MPAFAPIPLDKSEEEAYATLESHLNRKQNKELRKKLKE